MRVIIAGSREFNDYNLLVQKCNEYFYQLSQEGLLSNDVQTDIANMEIVSGTAKGADKLGERFAEDYNIKIKRLPANWDLYGKSAGYRRNEEMALYAKQDNGVLIAFWDGKSKGTKHMIQLANRHELRVFVVNF